MINRIGDFEAGINSLQISQIVSLSTSAKFHQPYEFLKWGAFILAFVASLSTIVNRIKSLIFRLHGHFFAAPKSIQQDEDYSYDSDQDSSCSSVSSDEEDADEEEVEDEDEPSVSFSSQIWRPIDGDFSAKGSGHYSDHQWQNGSLRKRRNRSIEDLFSSLSEFTNGKNVVKLWDNLGLGFRFHESRNHISVFDAICDQNLFSIFGDKSEIPDVSVSSSSPAVIVSAESTVPEQLLKVWDMRVGGRLPEILAEWKPKLGKLVGMGGGGGSEKVYVRDGVTGRLTVGDMRKLSSPLVTEDLWCDADGDTESVDEVSGGGDSVLRRG